ncbi:MAG: chromate transporter [Muribaculaceae bacterium]|nr:chromate transporter [Muribaculaceae bacterium]
MSIYLKMIWAYLKIGIFGFGGGYAMLSLVERSVVGPGWITEQMFTDIVAISQMTPGPIGINSATYIGYVAPGQVTDGQLASPIWGILGSILCTLAVTVPSFILVIKASHFIRKHNESGVIKAIFSGLRPVVVGLIASAAIMLMNWANFSPDHDTRTLIFSIAICAISFCLVYFKIPYKGKKVGVHPILVICLMGLTGFLLYY